MKSAEIELRNNREGLEKSAGGGGGKGGRQNLTKTVLRIAKTDLKKSAIQFLKWFQFLNLFRSDLNYSSIASYIIRSILDTTLRF